MDWLLNGRAALVTGGGSGIGRATALALARSGASVVVTGRRPEPLKETADLIRAQGGTAEEVVADTTSEDDMRHAASAAVERFGALHIACNNAGVPGSGLRLHEYSDDDWRRITDTNLRGLWLAMKHEVVRMLDQPPDARGVRGTVVNVASIAGVVGYLRAAPYAAGKHGVVGLTRTAAVDYGPAGIRVNAVCPGPVETPMLQQARARRGGGADDFYLRNTPLGRLGTPEEIADAVVWLASDAASFVTGQALGVDGGWTAQ